MTITNQARSPDGKTIVVTVMLRGEKVKWVLDAVSVADGSFRELYSYNRGLNRAAWLPDGESLLMTIPDQAGRGQLWAISYPGGKLLRLTKDGKWLQYLLTRNGVSNIWEQSLEGGEAKQVTQFSSGRIFGFDWSADGTELFLARGEISSDIVLISNFR